MPVDRDQVPALLAASGIVPAPGRIERVVGRRVSEDVDREHSHVAALLGATGIGEAPDSIADTVRGWIRGDADAVRPRPSVRASVGRWARHRFGAWRWRGRRWWLVAAPAAPVCSLAAAWAAVVPPAPQAGVGTVGAAPLLSQRHGVTDAKHVLHGNPPHFERLTVMFQDSRQLSLAGAISRSSTYAADVGLLTPAPTLIATLRGAGRIVGVADAYRPAYDAVVSVEVAGPPTDLTGPSAAEEERAPLIELGPAATSATLAAHLLFVPPGDVRRVVLAEPDGRRVRLTLRVTEVGLEMRSPDAFAP